MCLFIHFPSFLFLFFSLFFKLMALLQSFQYHLFFAMDLHNHPLHSHLDLQRVSISLYSNCSNSNSQLFSQNHCYFHKTNLQHHVYCFKCYFSYYPPLFRIIIALNQLLSSHLLQLHFNLKLSMTHHLSDPPIPPESQQIYHSFRF